MKNRTRKRLPEWMRMTMPKGENYSRVKNIVQANHLHTICTSGNCPNIAECWNRGTATFMILGDICTRSCKFCGVKTGKPNPADTAEPLRVAKSIQKMELNHCVITSVDRDDLPDGGSKIWKATIIEVKRLCPDTTIEVLIPDFRGIEENIKHIIDAHPEVISHNLETVRRLTPYIRSSAQYDRSLEVIRIISSSECTSKSGIMLGLGEKREEVVNTMDDLINAGCEVLTLGQYLQPSFQHMPVHEYIPPDMFEQYRDLGLKKGFKFVESSPLVRSSYKAEKHVTASSIKNM